MSHPLPCACQAECPASEARRKIIKIAAASLAVPLAFAAGSAHSRPSPGDWLVKDDAEGEPIAIRADDLQPGKPMLAFPFDPATKKKRDESRLNKIVLVRFAENELDAETSKHAVSGVLAFSAICTHQACEVKTWIAKDKALVCFCHASKFLPLEAGKVVDGPATRSLPMLPLGVQDGQLVVTGTFSSPPGSSS